VFSSFGAQRSAALVPDPSWECGYESDCLQGAFSEGRMQDGAFHQPLGTLDFRQVASIPSDPPQHLALQNKDTLQRIRTE
jgi:hypothetical protein